MIAREKRLLDRLSSIQPMAGAPGIQLSQIITQAAWAFGNDNIFESPRLLLKEESLIHSPVNNSNSLIDSLS